MLINIPKQPDWHCPAGSYPAICSGADIHSKPSFNGEHSRVTQLRLVFTLQIPHPDPTKEYVVRKYFPLPIQRSSELQAFLMRWLSPNGIPNGELDTEQLKGLKANVHLEHYENPGFPFPYVNLVDINPAEQKPVCRVPRKGIRVYPVGALCS